VSNAIGQRGVSGSLDVSGYYRHIRALGSFPAADCLRMAREAVALDEAAEAKRPRPGPQGVCWEAMPDGSAPIRLSFTVLVF
jgi:hypothetical protein